MLAARAVHVARFAVRRVFFGFRRFLAVIVTMIVTVVMPMIVIAAGSVNVVVRFRVNQGGV